MISLTDERIIQIAYDFVNWIIKFTMPLYDAEYFELLLWYFYCDFAFSFKLDRSRPIHSNSMGKKNEQDILHSPFFSQMKESHTGLGWYDTEL